MKMKTCNELHVVILAAGQGKRMKSSLPKVLHKLGGKPLLAHVIAVARKLHPKKIHVLYGVDGEKIFKTTMPGDDLHWVLQKKPLGTGHAVLQVLPFIPKAARVLILYGDVPLIKAETLQYLLATTACDSVGILTAEFSDPNGFGRIIRTKSGQGRIKAIIEDKDATSKERAIKEINTGIMLFPGSLLKAFLPLVKRNNAQKEYYLTDAIAFAVANFYKINGVKVDEAQEVFGVNDKVQLVNLERFYQKRQALALLEQGITVIDPMRFDLRGELIVDLDVTFDVNVVLEGSIYIGANSYVGSNCFLRNVKIGKNVLIKPNCVVEDSIIEDDCIIGPFARIRPESRIKAKARIGNFVEVKKSEVGKGTKISHLTYIGDSLIGSNVNIGAGVITVNYDGNNKHKTVIEDGAFIGSDVQLIAPIKIGKDATIGAGSTIVEDAPAKKLTLARARQVTIERWKRKKK